MKKKPEGQFKCPECGTDVEDIALEEAYEDWEDGDPEGISTVWTACPDCGTELNATYNVEKQEPDITIVKIERWED